MPSAIDAAQSRTNNDSKPFNTQSRRWGRVAERLDTTEKANDVQRELLEAAARRPRDRNELAQRLRDGDF
jgi:hypothetical protein